MAETILLNCASKGLASCSAYAQAGAGALYRRTDVLGPHRPNLYARGDKTRVYFFTKDELAEMFSPSSKNAEHRFETINLGVDRRLLMNRKRQLKMYRIWMQGIFRKPGGEAVQSGTADDSAASAEKVQA